MRPVIYWRSRWARRVAVIAWAPVLLIGVLVIDSVFGAVTGVIGGAADYIEKMRLAWRGLPQRED